MRVEFEGIREKESIGMGMGMYVGLEYAPSKQIISISQYLHF